MATMVVLGSGIMATALSFPVTENGHEVRLVGTHLDREIIDSIQKTGVHPNLGLKVNENIKAYQLEDVAEAFEGADVVMCGVNSFGIEWIAEQFKTLLKPGQKLLCVTKGMRADEDGTLHLLPTIIQNATQGTCRSGFLERDCWPVDCWRGCRSSRHLRRVLWPRSGRSGLSG